MGQGRQHGYSGTASMPRSTRTVDENPPTGADLVLSRLPEAARECLEELMTNTGFRFQSDLARRSYAEGKARAVLSVLETRGVEVPENVRADIASSTDIEQIETWLRRAATADKYQDLDLPVLD
ncbi:hypothetical protein ACQP00_09250 [Dactylosporangium sp. CS-047395]|uniref:hypothetical protein n=1 Tax=Dactylosporangium sp. CS-047395 TaxID=3239936 RepID=UPI003D92DF97